MLPSGLRGSEAEQRASRERKKKMRRRRRIAKLRAITKTTERLLSFFFLLFQKEKDVIKYANGLLKSRGGEREREREAWESGGVVAWFGCKK